MNVGLVSLQSSLINYSARQHVFKPIVLLVAGLALAIIGGLFIGCTLSRIGCTLSRAQRNRRVYHNTNSVYSTPHTNSVYSTPHQVSPYAEKIIYVNNEDISSKPYEHIRDLAKSIRSTGLSLDLNVNFQKHEGANAAGDGGGPTRQFFNLLFQSLKIRFSSEGEKPEDFILHTNKNITLLVSQGKPTNDPSSSIFYDIGTVMMYVYFSDLSPLIGPVFHESFFAAILSLEDHEIDLPYDQLPDATKLKMCKALINTQQASGEYLNSYLAPLALLEKGEQATDAEINSEQVLHFYASAAIEAAGDGPRDHFLLPGGDDMTLEGVQFNMDAIRNDKRLFLQNCLNFLLQQNTDSLGTIGLTLFPIHAMAKGMKDVSQRSWDNIRSLTSSSTAETSSPEIEGAKILQRKIQGVLDREVLVSKILTGTYVRGEVVVKKQVDWIKAWILDPTTTDTLIEGLLTFWTGSSYIDWDKVDRIFVFGHKGLIPGASTCSRVLYVSERSSQTNARGELGLLHNHTAEGYYQVLNKIAGEYSNVYTKC